MYSAFIKKRAVISYTATLQNIKIRSTDHNIVTFVWLKTENKQPQFVFKQYGVMMFATVAYNGYFTSQVQFEHNLPKSTLTLLLSNHRNQSVSRVSVEKVTKHRATPSSGT